MYNHGLHKYLFGVCCAACAFVILPGGIIPKANAQKASNDFSFEVATVKPVLIDASHPFAPNHFGPHVSPSGASYWSMTVQSLVAYAYGIDTYRVAGPESTTISRFDIEARIPDGADRRDDRRMLQALLKDRFKLTFHVEKRELAGYALVLAKQGEKLRLSPPDPVNPEADTTLKQDGNGGESSDKSRVIKNHDGSSTIEMRKGGTQKVRFDQEKWAQHFEFSKLTIKDLARRLSACLSVEGHSVVDETELEGTYQVAYDCPLPGARPSTGGGATASASLPDLPPDPQETSSLTRSLDALGLKLEKRKTMMDVYVIDHVDKPSEN